jgi:hypothetical protein
LLGSSAWAAARSGVIAINQYNASFVRMLSPVFGAFKEIA